MKVLRTLEKKTCPNRLQKVWYILSIHTNTTVFTMQYNCAIHKIIIGLIKMIASWHTEARGLCFGEVRTA